MADQTKIDYIAHKLDTVAEKVVDMSLALTTHVVKFEAHVEHEATLQEELKRNSDILHQNTSSLLDHIRRTELLEDFVKKIDARFTPVELEAMRKKAVSEWMKGKIFFLAKLGAAMGALGTIFAILRFALQVI